MTTPTPLIEIPTVVAIQLVPSTRIPLASGTLALGLPPTTSDTTKLLLTIDSLTIPLPSASITVCTKDKLTYLLATPLSRTDTGFVELTLPSIAAADTAIFERILESHGFLKNTLVADVDGLVDALREAIDEAASEMVSGGGGEVHFPDTIHKITAEGGAKIAELSGIAARVVSSATFEAGKWVGEKLGVRTTAEEEEEEEGIVRESEKNLPRETVDQTSAATSAAASSLGQSAESTSRTAEEHYGQEARELVGSARETTGNVGKVAVDAALGTSVIWQAGEAAGGCKDGEEG